MKITKIWKKKHKWFWSFMSFGLLGAITLAACSPAAKVANGNQTDQPTNSQNTQEAASSEELKLTKTLLQKQTFQRYLSSFPLNLEEAFQIPKNTLQGENILVPVSSEDFKYVFQDFFEGNEAVIGNLAGSTSAPSGMYQTIGVATDDQNQQNIYGYLKALVQNNTESQPLIKDLAEKIKTKLASLISDLNAVKLKINAATTKTRTAKNADYLNKQAAVLSAAEELVKEPNNTNWNVLKNNVDVLKGLAIPVVAGLEKVTGKINQLKTDFENLSKTMGANTAAEISSKTELNSLLNKFSELFVTTKTNADTGHEINFPFDQNASLLKSKDASNLLKELDAQVDFANFFTKVHANDSTTVNLLALHYKDNVSEDLTNLRKGKSKNLLVALTKNDDSNFLKNLKTLRTSLESYKVLLGEETDQKSISFAIKQAQEALKNDTTLNTSNKGTAESTLSSLSEYLNEFKKQFKSLQTDLDNFAVSLEGLEAKATKIMGDLEKAGNFGDFLNVISQSISLKNEILEINKLVPLLNKDNTSNLSSPLNLGVKIDALREQDGLRQLKNQGEQLLKYIQGMSSDASTILKSALEKVTNATTTDSKTSQTGTLDQFLYGSADWNETKIITYGLNGYQGQKMEAHSSSATNLKDFLNNFGTSNQSDLTALGQVQKLINENYTLERNPQSFAILNNIIQMIK